MPVAVSDPIAVEVHRRALQNITTEMAITITRTSGSPVIYEVQDFATCLMDREGEHLSMSAAILFHAGSSLLGTQSVIESLDGDEPRPGDGWIVNDPFSGGAMHQGDVAIITPLFHDGDHVGWAFSNVHVIDIGGMGVSGFAPSATSVHDEALRFPATRIITDGVLDPGWERYIAANVRVPSLVLNDIRSMIAGNNVSQAKLTEVVGRFGAEGFAEYCELNKALTEAAFRHRIEQLPGGVYESREFVEFDGHGTDQLLEVRAELEVDGSDLRFTFAADEQIHGFLNATSGVVHGSVMSAILTALAYGDLPFNAGMWRPVSIDLGAPGSIVNAVPPVPVSCGHAITGQAVVRAARDLVNQACALSADPVVRGRVAGLSDAGGVLSPLTGLTHGGHPTVMFMMDIVAGSGGGAQTTGDGQDCYGATTTPGIALPSIETTEAQQPALYLWRRLVADSGGPGLHRGGQAIESAVSIYDTDGLAGSSLTCAARTVARGTGGGYPAGAGLWAATHQSNVAERLASGEMTLEEQLAGDTPDYPSHLGRLALSRGDVLRMRGAGAGGAGDPLLRDPAQVARDVGDGYVTATNAREAYGVQLRPDGAADLEATEERRAAIRGDRIGKAPTRAQASPATTGIAIALTGAARWSCGYCQGDLGAAGEDWRAGAVTRREPIAERFEAIGMHVRPRAAGAAPMMLSEHFCPVCAGLLHVDVRPEGATAPRAPRLKTSRT